ncbi:MAG TPA: cache domain-containing protein [Spirochaetota bacterium]|nr:cache domain-containing protein [Spirochaetota bacterium]
MKIRSFRLRILSVTTAVVMAAIITISAISIYITCSTLNRNMNDHMTLKLDSISKEIEFKLNAHSSLVKSLALLGQRNGGNISSIEHVIILKNFSSANAESFGFGIWYEPYLYKGIRYYGPYVYRDNGEPVYTGAYSQASYDFHNKGWYLAGRKADQSSYIAWSSPVFENASGAVLVSAVSPFFDSNKSLLGVAGGDFDISGIKKIIETIHDDSTGLNAFLLNTDGTLIASSDKTLLTNTEPDQHGNSSFAALGKAVKSTKNGVASVYNSGNSASVYFREISGTGWTLCLIVNNSSFYAPVWKILSAARAGIISEIVLSTDEQKAGIEQIRMAILELDTMTRQNAELFKMTSAENNQMADQAREMMALLNDFSVKDRS